MDLKEYEKDIAEFREAYPERTEIKLLDSFLTEAVEDIAEHWGEKTNVFDVGAKWDNRCNLSRAFRSISTDDGMLKILCENGEIWTVSKTRSVKLDEQTFTGDEYIDCYSVTLTAGEKLGRIESLYNFTRDRKKLTVDVLENIACEIVAFFQ